MKLVRPMPEQDGAGEAANSGQERPLLAALQDKQSQI